MAVPAHDSKTCAFLPALREERHIGKVEREQHGAPPSARLRRQPVTSMARKWPMTPVSTQMSTASIAPGTSKGRTMAVVPRTANRLNRVLPSPLPSASDVWPASAASMQTVSSGAEVPKPTITMPMITADTLSRRASAAAPRTNRPPPTISSFRVGGAFDRAFARPVPVGYGLVGQARFGAVMGIEMPPKSKI